MKRDLDKKLKSYSALAGAVTVLAPLVVDAEIVYTDVDPDSMVVNPGEFMDIDFNGDATMDMQLSIFTTSSGGYYFNFALAYGLGNGSFAGSVQTFGGNPFYFPYAYSAGASLGPGGVFQANSQFGSLNYLTADSGGGTALFSGGDFFDVTDKYLAVQFQAGGNTHYGWIRLDVGIPGPNNFITIKDYAFEAVPDAAIEAGATTGGVMTGLEDSYLSDKVNMYSFGQTLHLQISDIQAIDAQLSVYNISGQEILSKGVNNSHESVRLDVPEGIYVARLTMDGAMISRQLYLGSE